MANTTLYADFTKRDDAQRIVEGIAASSNIDRDKQIIDEGFLRDNYKQWSKRYGNIRYLHQPVVVGHVLSCSDWDPVKKGFYISAKISDDTAWQKIVDGEIHGFSVGIKNAVVVPDDEAPNGRLIGGEIIETSIVDVPASYQADFMVIKAATFDPSSNTWLDDGDSDDMDDIDLSWMCDGLGDDDIDVYKRFYSASERRNMDESDFAGPHRSFPINTSEDVANAARLIGHAKDPAAVKRRIESIARRKGLKLPDEWTHDDDASKTLDTSSGLQGYNLEGDKEDKTTVADENVMADVAKVADVDALRATLDGLVTSFADIRAMLENMASQSDPDKDGDVDNTAQPPVDDDKPEDQHAIQTTGSDAPNAVQDTVDNGLKTATIDKAALVDEIKKSVLAELDARATADVTKAAKSDAKTLAAGTQVTWHYRSGIGHGTIEGVAEKGDTSATTKYRIRQHDHHKGEPDVVEHFGSALTVVSEKSALADQTAQLADVVKSVQAEIAKLAERLEVVEQSPAPAKGVTMVVDKFATTEADKPVVDDKAKIAEIVKTVTAANKGLSPVIINQRVDAAIEEYKGGRK